ncbi:MAG: hypothetical protein OXI81_16315 [Paracoccaceae bacterium]|nr:hypothetical protein [Paracoccaceae bacterium]MDE2913107.1 hypothetical protein [Paracoccaceae bacterium]
MAGTSANAGRGAEHCGHDLAEFGSDPDADQSWRRTVAGIRGRIMDSFGVRCILEVARGLIRRLGFRHVSFRPVHPRAKPEIQEEVRN